MCKYDIIGDIHGHYDLLVKMLKELGYTKTSVGYFCEGRKVIFTGDYINRGPEIRKTIHLIREMVENGNALAILGNHELNAILYFTLPKLGKSYVKEVAHLKLPLIKTIEEYAKYPDELKDTIQWFRHLPIYLDLGSIRVVHGGWSDAHVETVQKFMNGEAKIKKSFLKEYIDDNKLNQAVNELVKGVEMRLPKDLILKDNKGISRRVFRIKWWEQADGKTFKEMSFGNRFKLPAYTIPKEITPSIEEYTNNLPPVFFGHYCLEKHDLIVKSNLCCVDRCVTRTQTLSAYRWEGETMLKQENLVHI
ncbi:MAG TPA: metallophosphoesterase [Prolixibacteraceae bacterium]|nr:metallophosphoesterase [Prolixibacteraceae bacterium]HPS11679.1 metallophosphoesterase [Prolixibacteraceae bacterium]